MRRQYVNFRKPFYNGQPEIWLVRRCLTKGALAIDIGASIGLYARELAKSGARVVAFEANPRVAEFARSVLPSNVVVENVALSSANGQVTLRIPINKRSHTVDDLATIEPRNTLQADDIVTQTVIARRLDDYGYADCGFIKMDVEGHEEAVLDGGLKLIERCLPVLMIELDDRFKPGIVGRVCGRLNAFGYDAYELRGGALEMLRQAKTPNELIVGRNLLFVPNGTELPILFRWDRFALAIRSILGR